MVTQESCTSQMVAAQADTAGSEKNAFPAGWPIHATT